MKESIIKLFKCKKRIVSFGLASLMGVLTIIPNLNPIQVHGANDVINYAWCLDGGLVWSRTDDYEKVPGPLVDEELTAQLYWAMICAMEVDVVNTINNQIRAEGAPLTILENGTEAVNREFTRVRDFPPGIKAAAADAEAYVNMYNRGKGYSGTGTTNSIHGKEIPEWYINTSDEQPYILRAEEGYSIKVPVGSEDFWDFANIWVQRKDGSYCLMNSPDENDSGWTFVLNADVCTFSYSLSNEGNIPPLKVIIEQKFDSPYQVQQGVDADTLYNAANMHWFVCTKVGSFKPEAPRQRLYMARWPSEIVSSVAYISARVDPIPTEPKFEIYRHEEIMEADYNFELYKYDYETGEPLQNATFEVLQSFTDKAEISDEDGAEAITSNNTLYTPATWDGYKVFDNRKTDANGKITISDTRRYQYSKTYCDGHVKPKEPEFDDDGDPESASDAYEAAMEIYEMEMELWQNAVDSCSQLADEYRGVHFHWLTDSSEKESAETSFVESGVKADCEATYEKFINLEYTYAVRETIARDGYIQHDVHNDDVPIEIITTNSSQAGAQARFANGYSRDIGPAGWANVSWNATVGSGSSSGGGVEDINGDEEDIYGVISAVDTVKKILTLKDGSGTEMTFSYKVAAGNKDIYYYGSNKIRVGDEAVIVYHPSGSQPYEALSIDLYEPEGAASYQTGFSFTNISKAIKSFFANILFGTSDEIEEEASEGKATSSNAYIHFDVDEHEEAATPSNGNYIIDITSEDVDTSDSEFLSLADDTNDIQNVGGSNGDVEAMIDGAIPDEIEHLDHDPGNAGSDNITHVWKVYDHRTEGEIHFNKKDLDLHEQKDEFDSYGTAQADGTLEGAVYGLFASMDLIHPDGKTGAVYKAGDLVSIATTDRNGDGSFMAYTEQPGMTYNYNTGQIQNRSDIDWIGPENLYTKDVIIDDYNKDGNYTNKETGLTSDTTRFYMDNRTNNGNEWIGRPLILGNYFIKELTRSEGYELSINGRLDVITNRDAGLDDSDAIDDSILYISQSLMASNMEVSDGEGEDFSFKITSQGKGEDGFDIVLKGLPDGLKIYREDDGVARGEYQRPTGNYIKEYLYESDGSPKWKRAESNYSDMIYENGQPKVVDVEMSVNVTNLSGYESLIIDNDLVEDAFLSDGTYDEQRLAEVFSLDIGDVDNNKFVKYKIEKALRANGYMTPFASSGYSTLTVSVFNRGVREGDIDYYGVSGVLPGEVAEKTVYGSATSILNINKDAALTTRMVMEAIIQYFDENNFYNYGGVDSIRDKGTYWEITLYNDLKSTDSAFFTYSGSPTSFSVDTVFYRRPYVPSDSSLHPRYAFATYTRDGSDVEGTNPVGTFDVIGTWSTTLSSGKTTARGSFTLHPDSQVEGSGDIVPYVVRQNAYYKKGEIVYDKDGERIQEYTWAQEMETVEGDIYMTRNHELDAQYVDGEYHIHIDTKYLDEFGELIDDTNTIITQRFLFVTDKSIHTLTQDDIDLLVENPNDYQVGDQIGYSDYLFIFKRAAVVIASSMGDDSYIEPIMLSYPTQMDVYQDVGTRLKPIQVLERPIRQRVKVIKKIDLNEEGRYANDTYGSVHEDDFTSNYSGESAVDKMEDFRFKMYLKSNLERLYRDEDGKITWLDRNGNELIPEYRDSDGSGIYDSFIWMRVDGKEIDYPEISVINKDGGIESTNVQKIYTKVEHNVASITTGDRANNVWAEYGDPQTGFREGVGQKRSYVTSEHKGGTAIHVNDSLYSYADKNWNVKKTDKLNAKPNTGYTRLLETITTKENESYNYEKFFDAIHVANTDKWDSDLASSQKNYPGQSWENTFDEQYQKDDKDTSFKPFAWIRKNLFGSDSSYPANHDNDYIENQANTSDFARKNAEASDMVRQFALDWYLEDEVAKLLINNNYGEDVAKEIVIEDDKTVTVKEYAGRVNYGDEIHDIALYYAIEQANDYLKPYFAYDLDTIYSVLIDTESDGGVDKDTKTLGANILDEESGYYYGVTSYLPYGDYVLVEQQPSDTYLGDFKNKHYKIDAPKEVSLPTLYEEGSTTTLNTYYTYDVNDTPEQLASKYKIRFNEEWADNHTDDLRNYIIRAHSHNGDYEIYKFGLGVDKIQNASIDYNGNTYTSAGFSITQDEYTPLKRYYNNPLVAAKEEGGSEDSHYYADDKDYPAVNANAHRYKKDEIEKVYHYGSVSEHAGILDGIKSMTGIKTAYDGNYSSTLVPWTVVEPIGNIYDSDKFAGYVDSEFKNIFYKTYLRIEKIDAETGENILHDSAIFALYAAERYTNQKEVDKAIANGAPASINIGDVKFYLEDTFVTGSYEYLKALGAKEISPVTRIFGGATNRYTGMVPAGTPACKEDEQILLYDEIGAKTGEMTVFTTTNDVEMVNEEDAEKAYHDQNTGYVMTPQPIGAGVYVLAELKAPAGYVGTKPIAIEIYSDGVTYYMDGNIEARVNATIYKQSVIDE